MRLIRNFFEWIFFAEVHERELPQKEPRWWTQMIAAGLVVVLLLVVMAIVQYRFVSAQFPIDSVNNDSITRFGISGDFFGFANAMFSALAFSTIIVTLWMQKHELKQQRKELDQTQKIMELQIKEMELQRQEMEDQREEMHNQNESLRRQRFENTFFNMLKMHSEIVSGIQSSGNHAVGRTAFGHILASIKNHPAPKSPSYEYQKKNSASINLLDLYDDWYRNHESEVGHYFRTLYNIMRYVDEYGGDERRTYARLVRAQLSSSELRLLLFNGLSHYGRDKMKPIIERYALLKHLRETDDTKDLRSQYEPSAFGVQLEQAVSQGTEVA